MMDTAKPSSIHNLNNRLLGDAFKVQTNELTSLFNESIIQKVFPDDWKMGVITPIPKPGNLLLKTNWRPITILNTLGKLLEKIIHLQTSTYLKPNKVDAKRTNMVTGCVYIDYQKAFDTIGDVHSKSG